MTSSWEAILIINDQTDCICDPSHSLYLSYCFKIPAFSNERLADFLCSLYDIQLKRRPKLRHDKVSSPYHSKSMCRVELGRLRL